jgi:TPR repeat protein
LPLRERKRKFILIGLLAVGAAFIWGGNFVIKKRSYSSLPNGLTLSSRKAETGDISSQKNLCISGGYSGLVPDSLKWCFTCAEAGDKDCQGLLGHYYSGAAGKSKVDYVEAAKWFERGENWSGLAGLYAEGHGVERNYEKAAELYRKAGNSYPLALLYLEGKGVPQDYKIAADLLREAAGNPKKEAQYQLALLYSEGKGMEQNYEEAYYWALLTQRPKVSSARVIVDDVPVQDKYELLCNRLASYLTPEQIASVKKRVQDWKPRPPASGKPASNGP